MILDDGKHLHFNRVHDVLDVHVTACHAPTPSTRFAVENGVLHNGSHDSPGCPRSQLRRHACVPDHLAASDVKIILPDARTTSSDKAPRVYVDRDHDPLVHAVHVDRHQCSSQHLATARRTWESFYVLLSCSGHHPSNFLSREKPLILTRGDAPTRSHLYCLEHVTTKRAEHYCCSYFWKTRANHV